MHHLNMYPNSSILVSSSHTHCNTTPRSYPSINTAIHALPLTLLSPYLKANIYNVFYATKITHILRIFKPSKEITKILDASVRKLMGIFNETIIKGF